MRRQGRGGYSGLPNKGMKLTSVEHIGRSQLIPGVRPTAEQQHEEAAPGVSTARV
jgi:hypothetical protein